MRIAIQHRCVDSNVKEYMTEHETIAFVQRKNALSHTFDIRTSLNNMEILALLNAAWDVSVVKERSDGLLYDAPLTQVVSISSKSE